MECPLGLINEKPDMRYREYLFIHREKKIQIFLNFLGEGKKCKYRQSEHRQLILCRNKQNHKTP